MAHHHHPSWARFALAAALLGCLSLLAAVASAEECKIDYFDDNVYRVNVPGLAGMPDAFSHATVTGSHIFVSGTLGTLNDEPPFILAEGVYKQTQQALKNIHTILHYVLRDVLKCFESSEKPWERVLKTNIYMSSTDEADFLAMKDAYVEAFKEVSALPALTAVSNVSLALGALVEIEVVASVFEIKKENVAGHAGWPEVFSHKATIIPPWKGLRRFVYLSGVLGTQFNTTEPTVVSGGAVAEVQQAVANLRALASSSLELETDRVNLLKCAINTNRLSGFDTMMVNELFATLAQSDKPVSTIDRRRLPAGFMVQGLDLALGARLELDCSFVIADQGIAHIDVEGVSVPPSRIPSTLDSRFDHLIEVSGMLGTIDDKFTLAEGGIGNETHYAMLNVLKIVSRSYLDWSDPRPPTEAMLAKCIVYMRDSGKANFDAMNAAYSKFFTDKGVKPPARMSLSGAILPLNAAVMVQCTARGHAM